MTKESKNKILKAFIVVGVLALIFLAIYLPLELTGTLAKISDAEDLKQLILSGGVFSYLIFFVLQFLQVTFLPIPAVVTTIAGTLVFGPWITLGLSFVAVMLASIFSFFLGRKIGKKVVVWVAGEKDYEKWNDKLTKGKYVFFLMMLFPVFPDDILCMVVGTTNMSWKFFILTNLITRPIGIACTCFLGSGIIPFEGWWWALWAVLAIACLVLFILCYKYQDKIEKFILKLSGKLEKKDKNAEQSDDAIVNSQDVNEIAEESLTDEEINKSAEKDLND